MAPNLRPEAGLLAIRKGLNLFANLRPAYLYNELADACRMSIISNDMLVTSLHRLNALLSIIYNGDFKDYLDELERYEVLNPALNHLSKLQ